jgi:ComF family protein
MPVTFVSPSSRNRFAIVSRLVCSRVCLIWQQVAAFALPNLCGLCGNLSQQTLCEGCDAACWNETRLRCAVCAIPLAASLRQSGRDRGRGRYQCGDCVSAPPSFDATFTLADYRAPLDALALGLKFRARLMLAREFGERLARLADDALETAARPDVIAPVPLARRRLIERGYNQAWEIAKPLADALHIRRDATLIRRIIDTAPQSRLDLDARRENVGRAFAVAKPVKGLHVAIVDDVMTSGATLEAVARTLKLAGARRVTCLTALRTPKN